MPEKQLRIAMISAHSCPMGDLGSRDTGGMNVYIRELAAELGRRGHAVDVYTRAHDIRDPQVVQISDGARLIHLAAGEVGAIHKLLVYSHLADFACALEDFRKAGGLEYDLIHSHYWLSGWAGDRIQSWWRVPHITMFHTLGAVKNAIGIGEDEPELRTETERELVMRCDRIIAPTVREKEQLEGYYGAAPDRTSVIPCGVNLDLFQPADKQDARMRLGLNGSGVVLYVGRIEPLKGIDRLIGAIAKLHRSREISLLVVGGDEHNEPETQRLREVSRELDIENRVVFCGRVKQEDLPQYYAAADVCVVASFYESFGLVALESLACGTPVVATRVGGMEDIIRPGSGHIVGENPDEIAGRIADVLSSPDRTSSIRDSVTRFGWSNIAAAIERLYLETLLTASPGRPQR